MPAAFRRLRRLASRRGGGDVLCLRCDNVEVRAGLGGAALVPQHRREYARVVRLGVEDGERGGGVCTAWSN